MDTLNLDSSVQTAATSMLADFAVGNVPAAMPHCCEERLRECFLDFVGVAAFAAQDAESSRPFRTAVISLAPQAGEATVIADSRGYPPQYAALLNGAFGHTLDFDDTNQEGVLHPGVAVIPAAMAEAERLDCDGEAFIQAMGAGYEVACRVGAALGPTAYERGFHVTSVAGLFGGVAAIGRLRGLDHERMCSALGIAGSRAAGSMQCLANGAWNKRLHPGFSSHDAFLCVALAEAGVLGAERPVEGGFGLLTGYSNAPRPDLMTKNLGSRWLLLGTAFKPYPGCRMTHAAIDAVLRLRKESSASDRRAAVFTVRLSATAMRIVGERQANKVHPSNIIEAQFSIYFQMAIAWLDGWNEWSSYRRLGSVDVAEMSERISVEVDASLPMAGAEVVLELHGRRSALRVDKALGEPEQPLSWGMLERKFLALAEPVYGVNHARRIAQRIQGLPDETSMRDLVGILKSQPSTDPQLPAGKDQCIS